MGDTISFNRQGLTSKISKIKSIGETLNEDSLVKTMIFGSSSSNTAESKGTAVTAVKELNTELDTIAKKLALLNERTTEYLNGVITTFDLADNNL